MERAGPGGVLAGAFQLQRSAGFGVGLARQRDQHGGAVFHGAAQSKPGSERDAAGSGGRDIAEIEDDEAETAALNQQVGGFEGVLGVIGGANPKEAVEMDAGIAGRSGVEGIFGVDEGADFFAMGGGSKDGEQKAGSAGRRGAEDLGEASAGESASGRVEGGNAGGDALGRGAGLPIEMAAEYGFEFRFEGGGRHCIRFLFALTIFLPDEVAACQDYCA